MNENCVPYKRKSLYLLMTLPMIVLYIVVAAHLWTVGIIIFTIYCAFFVMVAISMGYVCVHWRCPYIGKFGPCAGGFCLPASQIARLFKKLKRSETTYHIVISVAYANFFGILFFPVYFMYKLGIIYLLAYLGVNIVYWLCLLLFICPFCGTRHVCHGGQTAIQFRELLTRRSV